MLLLVITSIILSAAASVILLEFLSVLLSVLLSVIASVLLSTLVLVGGGVGRKRFRGQMCQLTRVVTNCGGGSSDR